MKLLAYATFFLFIMPYFLFSMLQTPYSPLPKRSSQLVDGSQEALPTDFLVQFAHLLQEEPKNFLDRELMLPCGTVREFLGYKHPHNIYQHKSVQEHEQFINTYIVSTLLDNDDLCAKLLARLLVHNEDEESQEIKLFFENKILEKKRNEEYGLQWSRFNALGHLCLGVNCGIALGFGLKLLKENTIAGYGALGFGILGTFISLPMITKSGARIFFANKRLQKYSEWLEMLKNSNTSVHQQKVIYYLSSNSYKKTH